VSLTIYRRHNSGYTKENGTKVMPSKETLCESKDTVKCDHPRRPCPIWVSGTGPDGKFIRQSLRKLTGSITRDWALASKAIREWEENGKAPAPVAGRATIQQLRDDFTAKIKGENLSKETIRKYKTLFDQLDAFVADKGLRFVDELDYQMLLDFRASWEDKALSAGKKLERLRSVMKDAVARGWVRNNAALQIKSPKVKWVDKHGQTQTGSRPTLPYSDAEMLKLKNYVGSPSVKTYNAETWAFILTMRFSGLAIQDTATLKITALENGHLILRRTKTGTPVTVLLPKMVEEMLLALDPKSSEYFFWTGTSEPKTAASVWGQRLRTVFTHAGIEKQGNMLSHRLRDTFAAKLLLHGASKGTVAELLGNTEKMVEKHYSEFVPERQERLDAETEKANGWHELQDNKPAEVVSIKRRRA
jgi:integrase/recombinase XerD